MLNVCFFVLNLLPPKFNSAQHVDTVSAHFIQGAVSPAWERTCLRAFTLSVPGPELDACLRSLTEALKKLVRGALQGKIEVIIQTIT